MNIHQSKNQPLTLLDFELLHLEKGGHSQWQSDEFEAVAVLIEGACSIVFEEQEWKLQRRNVFDDVASAIFVSPGSRLSIAAVRPTTLAICKARADKKFPTAFIPPEKMANEWRGQDGFKRRIFNIVNLETPTQHIAVGETINEPGEWSSFPPHKHDARVLDNDKIIEVPLEEIYYFRIRPETGFGFQRLYTADGAHDQALVVKDGDVVHIPKGYHPVANIPGHQLYYLWMLAGQERRYIWNTDPKFRWLE